MKRPLLLLSFWLITMAALGSVLAPDDTTRIPTWLSSKQHALSLPSLPIGAHRAHFRFTTGPYVVEGWRDVNGRYAGQFVLGMSEVVPDDEAPTYRVHVARHALDSVTVHGLFGLLQAWQMRALPDEAAIVGWRPTFDGVQYTLEYATPTAYAVKSYANPASQEALPEAKRVLGFQQQLEKAVQAPARVQAFVQTIPFQCYTSGGSVACRIVPSTQLRAYKRERNRYRATLK